MRTFVLLAAIVLVGCGKAPAPPAPPPPIDEAKAMAELEKLVAAVKERTGKPVGMVVRLPQPESDTIEWGRMEVSYGDVRYETERTDDSLLATIVVVREQRDYAEWGTGHEMYDWKFDSAEEAMLAEKYEEDKAEVSAEYVWHEGQWTPHGGTLDGRGECFPFTDVHWELTWQNQNEEEERTYSPFKVIYLYDPANPEELVEVK